MTELRVLGGLDLRGPGGEEISSVLTRAKRFSLLAYLAVARPRGFHRRDKLVGLFSPEQDDDHARSALRSSLHFLRQALGEGVIQNRGTEEVGLDLERILCDVLVFEGALEAGDVEGALELYRGPLLEGVFLSDCPDFERWLDDERERLREMAAGAAWTLAHRLIGEGRLTDAERTGQRALGLVGTDESAVRNFIVALAEAGDRAAAVHFYRKFEEGLRRDLELRPDAESRDLVERIRASMEIPVSDDGPPSSSPARSRRPESSPIPPPEDSEKIPAEVVPGKGAPTARNERLKAALSSRYAIEEEIGSGGMGTVYRATDLKHQRKVAVKVLKSEVSEAVEADRFLREIETAANLNHPHILPVHDSGEADGVLYYVTPYVATESLRTRMEREKQLPVEEAVRLASAVASALDFAHREGVIHRDIKPANILLQDGEPMLTDFGLAVGAEAAPGDRLTGPSVVVGSPEYMSPEQATHGQPVGPASDIYALGCVLYEMLTGEPPFTGGTAQAALAKVRTEVPRPLGAFRSMIPPNVDAAIRRALEKVPADRFSSGQKFAKALADPDFRHGQVAAPVGSSWNRLAVAGWSVAGLLGMMLAWSVLSRPPPTPPVVARSIPLFIDSTFAISPDGSTIVYGDGEGLLWRWERKEGEAFQILGTERAQDPSFSPDGSHLVFQADGLIRTVPLSGGPPNDVVYPAGRTADGGADLTDPPSHPSWGEDGMIYFAQGHLIYRVPADGGVPEPVTTKKGWFQGFPSALPGGWGVILTVRKWEEGSGRTDDWIAVVGPEGGEPTELVKGTFARYASGHLLYTTWDGTLMGVPFDLETRRPGSPVVLIGGDPEREAIEVGHSGKGAFDISRTGTLAYREGGVPQQRQALYWDGVEGPRPVDTTWIGYFQEISISPDHSRFAVITTSGTTQEIWVSSFDGVRENLEVTPEVVWGLGWTPDSESVTYLLDTGTRGEIDPSQTYAYKKRIHSEVSDELLLPFGDDIRGDRAIWDPDGEWFVYSGGPPDDSGPFGIWAWRYGTDDPPVLLVERDPDHNKLVPQAFSPDGRYMAYLSQESDSEAKEVWVAPFPNPDRVERKIDTGPAAAVRWSHDGETIFFRGSDDRIKGIEVVIDPTFSSGRIQEVFDASLYWYPFDVGLDDQSFLFASNHWLDQATGEKGYQVWDGFLQEVEERVGR